MQIYTSKAQSIVGTRNDGGRPKDDFYPTPPEVTRALLRVESFTTPIWEPACGDGSASEVLKETGMPVFSSDLYDHGYGERGIDFLEEDFLPVPDHPMGVGAIVTNPPFKLATEFIQHAIEDLKVDKLCLLMKLAALEGRTRSAVLRDTKLTKVYVFRNRIQLTRNGEPARGGGMIAFAWFVWYKGHEGDPIIKWIVSEMPGIRRSSSSYA